MDGTRPAGHSKLAVNQTLRSNIAYGGVGLALTCFGLYGYSRFVRPLGRRLERGLVLLGGASSLTTFFCTLYPNASRESRSTDEPPPSGPGVHGAGASGAPQGSQPPKSLPDVLKAAVSGSTTDGHPVIPFHFFNVDEVGPLKGLDTFAFKPLYYAACTLGCKVTFQHLELGEGARSAITPVQLKEKDRIYTVSDTGKNRSQTTRVFCLTNREKLSVQLSHGVCNGADPFIGYQIGTQAHQVNLSGADDFLEALQASKGYTGFQCSEREDDVPLNRLFGGTRILRNIGYLHALETGLSIFTKLNRLSDQKGLGAPSESPSKEINALRDDYFKLLADMRQWFDVYYYDEMIEKGGVVFSYGKGTHALLLRLVERAQITGKKLDKVHIVACDSPDDLDEPKHRQNFQAYLKQMICFPKQ